MLLEILHPFTTTTNLFSAIKQTKQLYDNSRRLAEKPYGSMNWSPMQTLNLRL